MLVGGLVKKTYHNAKTSDIATKYFVTPDHNKYSNEILNVYMEENELLDKFDISGFKDNSCLDKMTATLATKAELKEEQDKIVKRQVFAVTHFRS